LLLCSRHHGVHFFFPEGIAADRPQLVERVDQLERPVAGIVDPATLAPAGLFLSGIRTTLGL
jgi:hypothetical protein